MHWMLSSDNNVLGYQQHDCDVYRTNANVKVQFIEATTLLSTNDASFSLSLSLQKKRHLEQRLKKVFL